MIPTDVGVRAALEAWLASFAGDIGVAFVVYRGEGAAEGRCSLHVLPLDVARSRTEPPHPASASPVDFPEPSQDAALLPERPTSEILAWIKGTGPCPWGPEVLAQYPADALETARLDYAWRDAEGSLPLAQVSARRVPS